MREDIKACKRIAEAAPSSATDDPQTAAWAARQLGVHYLKRYFLLVAYRAYLDQEHQGGAGGVTAGERSPAPSRRATGEARGAGAASGGGGGGGASGGGGAFARWMEERRELGHLLGHLTLET